MVSTPNIRPNTGGTRLKNDPHPIPLIMMNTKRTAKFDANGHIKRALIPVRKVDTRRQLIGPNRWSAANPPKTRPIVDAKFQTAKPTKALSLKPWMAFANIGIKYGGIKMEKVERASPMDKITSLLSRKRNLYIHEKCQRGI